MRRRLELLDTSIIVELLKVPYECDHLEEVQAGFNEREAEGVQLQMPVTAIIETGAHVGRIGNGHDRLRCAVRFGELIEATLSGSAPWTFTPLEWDERLLRNLTTPPHIAVPQLVTSLAEEHLEMGDS